MPLYWTLREFRHLDAMQHLAGVQVADLEAEQLIYVHETVPLRSIDRERPDDVGERPDFANNRARTRVGHAKDR